MPTWAEIAKVDNSNGKVVEFTQRKPTEKDVKLEQMKECRDCRFTTDDQEEMEHHCCCQPYSNYCGGAYHKMKVRYCVGECLDCGWGGCICFQPHCCCPEDPVNCGSHEFVDPPVDG